MATKTYLQAISDGLREEMRRDSRVFLIGEDIGVYGGAFKVTQGFLQEFGEDRVIDSPLSETAIVGSCTGAALMGMRPVCEMQFSDFVSCAFDQLVTVAAKQHYRVGTPVPIVVRLPSGGGFSGGPFHSQNPEGYFAHCPGLKLVCPATPADAKGLLIQAIRDPNPVLYFEHKHLYRRIKGEVPDGEHTVEFGKARIHREGTDLSIITYGAMVYTAEEAATAVAEKDGTSVEIVDLRTVIGDLASQMNSDDSVSPLGPNGVNLPGGGQGMGSVSTLPGGVVVNGMTPNNHAPGSNASQLGSGVSVFGPQTGPSSGGGIAGLGEINYQGPGSNPTKLGGMFPDAPGNDRPHHGRWDNGYSGGSRTRKLTVLVRG